MKLHRLIAGEIQGLRSHRSVPDALDANGVTTRVRGLEEEPADVVGEISVQYGSLTIEKEGEGSLQRMIGSCLQKLPSDRLAVAGAGEGDA